MLARIAIALVHSFLQARDELFLVSERSNLWALEVDELYLACSALLLWSYVNRPLIRSRCSVPPGSDLEYATIYGVIHER